MQEEEATLLGKALAKSAELKGIRAEAGSELQRLKVDVMLLEPQTLLTGHTRETRRIRTRPGSNGGDAVSNG